ncbi:MAG: hypothetical protein HUJ51_00495 [Eggerthellaceae bacterium]|nr:hypothetical protein [Eggerthellaceae bacterium]
MRLRLTFVLIEITAAALKLPILYWGGEDIDIDVDAIFELFMQLEEGLEDGELWVECGYMAAQVLDALFDPDLVEFQDTFEEILLCQAFLAFFSTVDALKERAARVPAQLAFGKAVV